MTRATSELIIEPAIVRKNISYLKAKLDILFQFVMIKNQFWYKIIV